MFRIDIATAITYIKAKFWNFGRQTTFIYLKKTIVLLEQENVLGYL